MNTTRMDIQYTRHIQKMKTQCYVIVGYMSSLASNMKPSTLHLYNIWRYNILDMYIYYDKAKEAMLRMNFSYQWKLYSISDILTLKYGEWKVCYICKIPGHTLKCFKNFRSIFEVTTTNIIHNIDTTLLRLSFYFHFSYAHAISTLYANVVKELNVPLEIYWAMLDGRIFAFILNVFKHNKDSIWDVILQTAPTLNDFIM